MNLTTQMMTALAAGLLSGCATTVYEGGLQWSEGWRRGEVMAVGNDADIAKEMAANCRAAFPEIRPGTSFATIKYRRDRRYAWRTVPLASDSALKKGDLVYVNFVDCKAPVVGRSRDAPS